jgi:hypothetical protein
MSTISDLKKQAWIWVLVLYVLNIKDMLFTIFFLRNGFEEGNPVMDALWQADPLYFIAFKTLGIGAMTIVFYAAIRVPWHLWALRALTGVYTALVCYHLVGLFYFTDLLG